MLGHLIVKAVFQMDDSPFYVLNGLLTLDISAIMVSHLYWIVYIVTPNELELVDQSRAFLFFCMKLQPYELNIKQKTQKHFF